MVDILSSIAPVSTVTEDLFYYTSGYPFLVSKLCKLLDEDILPTRDAQEWTEQDLEDAVRQLIAEKNVNFDSLIKNLENNQDLYDLVYDVAIGGSNIAFNANEPTNDLGVLYGIFDHSAVKTWHSEWITHNGKKIFIVWV